MRRALMFAALPLFAGLVSCGDKSGKEGPERPTAAGQVLGGEVNDAMLPLDTVRSTSPVAPRAAPGRDAKADETAAPADAAENAPASPLEPVNDVPAAPRPNQTPTPGSQPSEQNR